jgi:hypothetical protein
MYTLKDPVYLDDSCVALSIFHQAGHPMHEVWGTWCCHDWRKPLHVSEVSFRRHVQWPHLTNILLRQMKDSADLT